MGSEIEYLKKINVQVDKLDFLLQSMVKISRLETDVIKIQKKVNSVFEMLVVAINAVVLKADKKNNSSVYGVLMPAIRFSVSMMMTTQSAFMSIIREKTMKDISILTRLSMASTGKKKEATNEAAEGEPIEESSSYQSEIASLFDFSF